MLDQFKSTVEKSQKLLEGIIDKIEDQLDGLSDDTAELWQSAKPKLQAMKESLITASESLHTQTDEARLQAHLATMDAYDQWSYLSATVTEVAKHAQKKGLAELQHADLQAHLATMETRAFMEKQGKEISRDYKIAKESVEKASHKAAQELERSFKTISSAWANTL